MTRAFVFPGQGAQVIGMGRDLAEAYPAARAVFDEVDAALGETLSTLIWEGDGEELTLTRNAQPALMATSHRGDAGAGGGGGGGRRRRRSWRGIRWASIRRSARPGRCGSTTRRGCCGCAGRRCRRRCRWAWGRWRRCWGSTSRRSEAVAAEAAQGEVCEAANDNDPAQVVVSGDRAAVERAVEIAKARGAKRAMLLPVSAPFHCALMQPAADRMAEALAGVAIAAPAVPLVANVIAEPVSDAEDHPQAAGAAGDRAGALAGERGLDGGAAASPRRSRSARARRCRG